MLVSGAIIMRMYRVARLGVGLHMRPTVTIVGQAVRRYRAIRECQCHGGRDYANSVNHG
jgi:hypothetical protein